MSIGVGLVGYGYAGRVFHSHLIESAPGLELRAVATRDPDRRARAESDRAVRTYGAVDDLLQDAAIELVVLATPHDTHAELACRALSAGKHVVVDKPMAITLDEADRMVEAARNAGRVLSVFHNRRWDWDFVAIRDVIRAGRVGRPYLYESTVLNYRQPRTTWRADPATMGSLVHDWGAHLVDHALLLVGQPVDTVSCRILRVRPQPAVGNYARIDLTFADGTLYAIEVGNLCTPAKPRWYVLGEGGGLVKHGIDPQERAFQQEGRPDEAEELAEERLRLFTCGVDGQPIEQTVVPDERPFWYGYYRNVADHLNSGAPLEVTAEQAREVVRVLDAAVRSARQQAPIALART